VENEHQDKMLNCRECGTDFIFSSREQDFYVQKGFDHEPTRCVQCRNVRRRERTVQPVGAAPVRNYVQSQPSYNNGNNGNSGNYANSRPMNSNSVRTGGISNGQRSSSYGNRQFGPNYSTLGRSSNYGNTTRSSGYNQSAGNGNSNGNYNRANGPISNGYHNPQVNYQERKMYPIVCANCGINTEVPFTPREGAPVFCRTCYNNQKTSR